MKIENALALKNIEDNYEDMVNAILDYQYREGDNNEHRK